MGGEDDDDDEEHEEYGDDALATIDLKVKWAKRRAVFNNYIHLCCLKSYCYQVSLYVPHIRFFTFAFLLFLIE